MCMLLHLFTEIVLKASPFINSCVRSSAQEKILCGFISCKLIMINTVQNIVKKGLLPI